MRGKYTVIILYDDGQKYVNHDIEKIHFHEGSGGIDLFLTGNGTPFFPGFEEKVNTVLISENRR